MWLWVLCAELVIITPLLIRGVGKDSIGRCYECATLRSMSMGLLILGVLCGVNHYWKSAAVLLLIYWLALMVGAYFEREYPLTEAVTENIHQIDLRPDATFRLENRTSFLMGKTGLMMTWLCAFGYMLCYHDLGLGFVLSFLAGIASSTLQFIILIGVAMTLFRRRVNARFSSRIAG